MSDLASLVVKAGRRSATTGTKAVDVITFIEAPWGLNTGLFPVQRVILKAHYGLALDDNLNEYPLDTPIPKDHPQYDPEMVDQNGYYKLRVPITDWRRENPRVFTEAGYLRYLYAQGRSNVQEVVPGRERREMILSIGRRSGKTMVSACIAAYETYKLISLGHPQKHYGLPDSNVIQIISIATDKDQAGLLYREVHGHFLACDFFATYMANATQSFARFQTPKDIERYGPYADNPRARFSVQVTFRSCIAKGLRGAGNIVVILDEVAHFTDDGQSSAEEVYNAVAPSTSSFSPKDPKDSRVPIGDVDGRIIMISSPLGKQGHFYKMFQIGMRTGKESENMLCIQAPTWEVNPTIPAHEFVKHYIKDPRVFFTEYGGEFTDRTRGWIEDERDLLSCISPVLRPRMKAPPRMPHFMGLDVALVGDPTAIAIGHNDDEGRCVVDTVDTIQAGYGRYQNQERLDFDDVADWVHDYSRRFYITQGMFDQWAGIPMEQALQKRGLGQIESVHHTRTLSSQIFQNFKDMMMDRRLLLYDWPIPEGGSHCSYIQELLELQAEMVSKYVVLVEAPNIDGKHDDQADALVRMVWLATNHRTNVIAFGNKSGSPGDQHRLVSPRALLAARQKSLLGGSHPSRQPRAAQGTNQVLQAVLAKSKGRGGGRGGLGRGGL